MRFSDKELEVIKNTFAENDDLLKKIRAHFLQMGEPVKLSKGALKVLRKTFLPEIEVDAPIHQIVDLYLTLDLKNKSPEEVRELVEARELLINYIDERLIILEGEKLKVLRQIELDSLKETKNKSATQIAVEMNARNSIIYHSEQCLMQLKLLAGLKDEGVDQTKKRLQDSSK